MSATVPLLFMLQLLSLCPNKEFHKGFLRDKDFNKELSNKRECKEKRRMSLALMNIKQNSHLSDLSVLEQINLIHMAQRVITA